MTLYKKLKTIMVFAFFMAVSSMTNAAVLTTYYHNDQLGSPIAATDEYGFKLWTENYQAYGERTVNNTNAQENRFWFTGKPQDSNTGLSYFGARYYDPLIGRFMAVDPVGARAGDIHNFNRYAYANNNPYRYVDPDGRIVVTAIVAVSLYLFAEYANTPTMSDDVVDVSGGDALFYTGLALVGGPITQNVSKVVIGGVVRKVSAKFVTKSVGKEIGILRDAAKGQGNFGLGSGTRAEADKLGKAWVGDGYKVASDGKTIVAKDGLRQYRPPSYKGNLDKTQANFEQKFLGQKTKGWQSNGHLDILD